MPFFFVLVGTYIDLTSFAKPSVLLVIVVFSAIAIVTKCVGAIWGARSERQRIAREVGAGMVPRGEVVTVVAGIALAAGAMGEDVYAAVLGMVLATTIVRPYLIKAAVARKGAAKRCVVRPRRRPTGDRQRLSSG